MQHTTPTTPALHPHLGLWVTADGGVRHELRTDGRYVEARGDREAAYVGSYKVTGDHIEYVDDTGFTADGDFRDDVLHHAGMVLRRRKVVLVTGASSGIGQATALRLVAAGHPVVLGARRTDRLDALVAEIEGAGGQALAVPLDVTDLASTEAFTAAALERFGRIDVLVANAGVMPLSPLAAGLVDEWDRMIDVNVRGLLHGIAATLPTMLAQGTGHVVTVASVGAYEVSPTAAVYCGTKFAARAITDGPPPGVSARHPGDDRLTGRHRVGTRHHDHGRDGRRGDGRLPGRGDPGRRDRPCRRLRGGGAPRRRRQRDRRPAVRTALSSGPLSPP